MKENFVRGFITSKLLSQEAAKTAVADSEEFKTQLAEAKEQLLQKTFIVNKVKELATDEAVKQRYDEFAKEQSTKEEVRARHILVSTEEEAKAIAEELKKGGRAGKKKGSRRRSGGTRRSGVVEPGIRER